MEKVVIIGASSKPDRYSHKAQMMLAEYGHKVFPVRPDGNKILGVDTYKSILDIRDSIDTVTLYVSHHHLEKIIDDILAVKPKRVIFTPGTESFDMMSRVKESGIEAVAACTLVMLSTNQF